MANREELRALREAAGLDIVEGLGANRVARLEDGRAVIRPSDVAAYRKAAGVDGRLSLDEAAKRARHERAERELLAAADAFEEATGRPASDLVKPAAPPKQTAK